MHVYVQNCLAKHYFNEENRRALDIKNQSQQVGCLTLRRNGRIQFIRDETLLIFPGEVTVAYKV